MNTDTKVMTSLINPAYLSPILTSLSLNIHLSIHSMLEENYERNQRRVKNKEHIDMVALDLYRYAEKRRNSILITYQLEYQFVTLAKQNKTTVLSL